LIRRRSVLRIKLYLTPLIYIRKSIHEAICTLSLNFDIPLLRRCV